MTLWYLITLFAILLSGAAAFLGISRGTPPGNGKETVSSVRYGHVRREDVSRELILYGGLAGKVEVARIRATPLALEDSGDGEFRVEVPGIDRPVYLSEPYAVVYFEPIEMSAAHALIMSDSTFFLSGGGKTYGRVMPRPIYPDGGWDAFYYKGAVAFEPIPAGRAEKITVNCPYSVDLGTPIPVALADARVDFPFSAFYLPGVVPTGQVKSE